MSIGEGRATIGVQQPSSDPYIESFDDRGVSELAQEVPLMLERARASGKTLLDIPLTRDPLPRLGVGAAVNKGRRRTQQPRKRQPKTSPRR